MEAASSSAHLVRVRVRVRVSSKRSRALCRHSGVRPGLDASVRELSGCAPGQGWSWG